MCRTAGRAAKVAGVVTVGTPYTGGPVLAEKMVIGETGLVLEAWWMRMVGEGLSGQQVKELIRTSPGAISLLPSEAYVSTTSPPYFRPLDGSTLSTYEATMDYFKRAGYLGPDIVALAETYHDKWDGFGSAFEAQDRYHVFYTRDRYTVSAVREAEAAVLQRGRCALRLRTTTWATRRAQRSASLERLSSRTGRASGSARTRNSPLWRYKEHGSLLTDGRIIEDILHVLKGEPTEHCGDSPSAAQAEAAPAGFREHTVWGTGRVLVVDGEGKFTGVNTDGILVRDLADVTYLITDGGVVVTMPWDADYTVVVEQEGVRSMRS